ncbi:MAG: hypothetical protein HOP03_04065 [Lysobacter sp.]|nr:hypothetical protein [Lysobacter sp.]
MIKKIKYILGAPLDEFLFHLTPPLAVVLTNRRVQKPTQERVARWQKLSPEVLLKAISDEWDRAKSLDDKLTKTTAALSIAAAVGGSASRPLLDGLANSPMKTVVLICVLFSILSLFSGIIMGFAGLRPKPRGGIGPDFAVMMQDGGEASIRACVDALSGFEVSNARRANEAAGANAAIRNGILSFVFATLLAIFAPREAGKPVVPNFDVDIVMPVIGTAEPPSIQQQAIIESQA